MDTATDSVAVCVARVVAADCVPDRVCVSVGADRDAVDAMESDSVFERDPGFVGVGVRGVLRLNEKLGVAIDVPVDDRDGVRVKLELWLAETLGVCVAVCVDGRDGVAPDSELVDVSVKLELWL
eukprot:PhM_4_TR18085/c2_g4_i1/m.106313